LTIIRSEPEHGVDAKSLIRLAGDAIVPIKVIATDLRWMGGTTATSRIVTTVTTP
jgi:hypothetical protein